MSRPLPHEAAERAVQLGGAGTVAMVRLTTEADLRWANSMLTTNGERSSVTLTVLCTAEVDGGTAVGTASGPLRSDDDLAMLTAQARRAAESGRPASDALPWVAGVAPAPDWDDLAPRTSGVALAPLTPQLADAFARGRDEGIEHFGYAEHELTTTWLASSTGLRLRHTQPTARLELTAKSHQRTRSAWAGRGGRDIAEFDVMSADAELRRGLAWQSRPVVIEPGRHDAVLTPSAVMDLMVYQYWSSSGRDAAEGRTVFSRTGGGTRVGEALTSAPLTLSSDPFDPELECAPFATMAMSSPLSSVFDLGLPLSRTDWMSEGMLEHLVASRYVAAEQNGDASPMVDNLRLTHRAGEGSIDEVVARTERGLLVNCLWYIREVDPRTLLLTGLTRDGVYVIEGGEVVGSAGNFRFNVSPVDVLAGVDDAGDTVRTLPREWGDYFNRCAAPPVRVAGFNFSTRSDAL